jgi:FkbM family methyltransferase
MCGSRPVIDLAGLGAVRCHPAAERPIRSAQLDDPQQATEFQQFLSHCHPGMLLFDIGASFGIFSLAAARKGGTAIAIDPSPIATRMIEAMRKLNCVSDRVTVLQAAVGQSEGRLKMLDAGVFSDGYYTFDPLRQSSELSEVRLTSVDHLAERFGKPTHIKIDVEGFEAEVLRGARYVIECCSPTIFLELHSQMVRAQTGNPNFCVEELVSNGYQLFSTAGEPIAPRDAVQAPITRIMALRSGS